MPDEAWALFDAVRAWQRGPRTSYSSSGSIADIGFRQLPRRVAGWLEPRQGEPATRTGLRPIPALRLELRRICGLAGLTSAERIVVTAFAGLTAYPSSRDGSVDPVTYRLPRARRGRLTPLDASNVARVRASATKKIAAVMPARSSDRVVAMEPASDPLTEPWLLSQIGIPLDAYIASEDFERAIERARDLLTVGDPGDEPPDSRPPADGDVDDQTVGRLALLDEMDELIERYRTLPDRRSVMTRELARARAALSISLYDTYYAEPPDGPTRSWEGGRALPAYVGRTLSDLTFAPVAAAAIARGEADDAAVAAVLADLSSSKDPVRNAVLLRMALSASNLPSKLTPVGRVRLLSAAVANARDREDRQVVHYARLLMDLDGTRNFQAAAAQLEALMSCSIVLSAHGEFASATRALDRARLLASTAAWPPGRDPVVERAEWHYQLELYRSAIHRRAAERTIALAPAALAAESAHCALRQLSDAERVLSQSHRLLMEMPALDRHSWTSQAGDADPHYLTRYLYRSVEIATLKIQSQLVSRSGGSRTGSIARQAVEDLRTAFEVAQADRQRSTPTVPLAKAGLALAFVMGDVDAATGHLRELLRAGWPPYRTVLPLQLWLAGRVEVLPPQMRDVVHAAGEFLAAGTPAPLVVPDDLRRHQMSQPRPRRFRGLTH